MAVQFSLGSPIILSTLMREAKNLVLIGFMGSGKSTVGRLVASELGMQFIDMDRLIEEREGCSISKVFSEKGEAFFRDLETEIIEQLVARSGLVIATGGGIIMRNSNVRNLGRTGVLICLRVNAETAFARTSGSIHRPLLMDGNALDRIHALLKDRQHLYDAIPNGIETSGRALQDVVRDVVRIYHQDIKSS